MVLESLRFEGEEQLKKVEVLHPKPKGTQPATGTVMDANDGVEVSVTCVCWNMLIFGHVDSVSYSYKEQFLASKRAHSFTL